MTEGSVCDGILRRGQLRMTSEIMDKQYHKLRKFSIIKSRSRGILAYYLLLATGILAISPSFLLLIFLAMALPSIRFMIDRWGTFPSFF